jgi:trk system potassium uptake protein TrkH
MNYRSIIAALGVVLIIIGLAMILPLIWSLYYGDYDWSAFLFSSIVTMMTGLIAYKATGITRDFRSKEAFAVVSLSWIIASVFGAAPYLLTGTFATFSEAFFETMSGFTTTGASVLTNIEVLPHGVLFWRSLTHWLGGMGIIVLFVAVLSSLGVCGLPMFRAESPGPVAEKIKPRISATAKILWYTYVGLTIAETLILWLLGMPLFDALCHTFGTLATGGFSTKNASIGYYTNPLIHWVIILFMFLSGANFALHYLALKGKNIKTFWRNGEFRLYSFIILLFISVLTGVLIFSTNQSIETSLRQAAFQVISIMTTTGYATADFDLWPYFAKVLLLMLMFVGGCSGSTGGSIKVGRILILLKQSRIELQRAMHPRAILNAKINGKSISSDMVMNVQQFFFIYIAITAVSVVIMSAMGLDLISAFTSVAATIGNIGPGLGRVGPTQNYSFVPAVGKYYLSFLMLLGRLELFTVLVLFLPSFWKK